MPISYKDGASTRTISDVYYKDGATLRTIKELWVGDGGTKRLVYSNLSASVSPTSVSGDRSTGGVATSNPAVASGSGGSGSYTYAWSLVSGGTGITITSPTSASTTFSGNVSIGTPSLSGVYKCTITDTSGATAVTANVNVSLTFTP